MITLDLLEKLVAFSECGTLQKAAKKLSITQPTITRSLQQLEKLLNVKLFDRRPNKLILTKTGELAASEAQKVLATNQTFVATVQNYAHNQTITATATLPAPLWFFERTNQPTNITATNTLINPATIIDTLASHTADVIFSSREIYSDSVESRFIGNEQLAIKLPTNSPLAHQKSVTFTELASEKILVHRNIGEWKNIIERHLPPKNLLYQINAAGFTAIATTTDFPVFRSNLTRCGYHDYCDKRPSILISDEAACLPVYATYRSENTSTLTPLLLNTASQWLSTITKQ